MPEDRHSGTPGGNGSGADVKSGIELALTDNQSRVVTFGTPFSSTPRVFATINGPTTLNAVDLVAASSISTTGFTLHVEKGHGGASDTWDVAWFATDAGDP